MLSFLRPKPAPVPPPEPTAADERKRLFTELRKIDHDLASIADAARAFRKEHFAYVDGRVVLVSQSVTNRDALETEWRAFSQRTYRATQTRSRILADLARAKVDGHARLRALDHRIRQAEFASPQDRAALVALLEERSELLRELNLPLTAPTETHP